MEQYRGLELRDNLKLGADNETLAENKVLILYLLSLIDKPINNDSLYRLVLSIQDMNYFYFQQFLLDLEENKYIINYEMQDMEVYEITETGKSTLDLTLDMLPGIIKLKVDETVKGEYREIQNESSIKAEFIPLSENEFIVKCKIIENNVTIFEVQTLASSREQAVRIVQNWEESAGTIYPNVLKMLNEEKEELEEVNENV